MTSPKLKRILVIRLGALGDIVLCFQAFADIRAAHPGAEIALLTMPPFAAFTQQMPWFDRVLTDSRAPGWRIDEWLALLKQAHGFNPARVYDLQGKTRQSVLFALMGGPRVEWSGAAPLCSHPRLWPPETGMHFADFLRAQLQRADVPAAPPADTGWCDGPLQGILPPAPYALLIPGCSTAHPYKRWPAAHYAALAKALYARDMVIAAVGTREEADVIAAIHAEAPFVMDLCGRTDLMQLGALARRAACVIGNNTGPAHLAAAVGAPTLMLMSERCTPAWSGPKGPRARWLQGKPLAALQPNEVLLALDALLDRNN